MAFIDHIHACNNGSFEGYIPFYIDGAVVGSLRPAFAEALTKAHDAITGDAKSGFGFIPDITRPEDRSVVLAEAANRLHDEGLIKRLHGEKFDVRPTLAHNPLCVLDRSAMSYFGFRSWGVHMNGFVRKSDGIHMWIAHRATDKPTYPGMLDNMVAGGQPAGLGFLENMIKECAEEADIPADLAANLTPVGTVSYLHENKAGIKPDIMVNYDLELPADFVPNNADGEVERFELMPITDVAEIVKNSFDFKFNCALVIIDFLIRHGIITADNEPDYCKLANGLHREISR
jgi:isopentenyldiphosphate isomerase